MRISAGPAVPGVCCQAISVEKSRRRPGTGYDAALAGRLLIWSTVPGAPLLPSSIARRRLTTPRPRSRTPARTRVIATSGSPALEVPGVDSPSVVARRRTANPAAGSSSTRVCSGRHTKRAPGRPRRRTRSRRRPRPAARPPTPRRNPTPTGRRPARRPRSARSPTRGASTRGRPRPRSRSRRRRRRRRPAAPRPGAGIVGGGDVQRRAPRAPRRRRSSTRP